jgi:hypothetical protein
MSDRTRHIAIDVSLTEDQIQGQVGDGIGAPTPFSGWLGLIGQLDELLGGGSSTAAAGDHSLSQIDPKEQ